MAAFRTHRPSARTQDTTAAVPVPRLCMACPRISRNGWVDGRPLCAPLRTADGSAAAVVPHLGVVVVDQPRCAKVNVQFHLDCSTLEGMPKPIAELRRSMAGHGRQLHATVGGRNCLRPW
eukprot:CAMPEP_0174979666 /NCGR_PEP_ID=MMETSP0004_2-20121128/14919_1 /TAXON_ID=420556 /ORGANISM="Ochromonas sp., Strain CCMP1393" /LENGTH=119 /DNA_ID=CAMNT_0016231241 /DNA_START=278 /DNA_END=634 /DNA_ORIENTATION=-